MNTVRRQVESIVAGHRHLRQLKFRILTKVFWREQLDVSYEISRVEELSQELGTHSHSMLVRRLAKLRRAQTAFEAGEDDRLFCGFLIQDLTKGQRQWLVKNGYLEHERTMLENENRES